MENLKIALVQSDLVWENKAANLKRLTAKIEQAQPSDVFILPEMFTTGFSMNAEKFAETMDDVTVSWLLQLAQKKQAVICGSIMIKENELYYNRFVWAQPDGELKTYDKRHTFTLAGEEKIYTNGKEKTIIDYKGWKICPLICYDLRFPVWARNTENYDVLLLVANWPAKRIQAWDALLKARAIENMSYTIGVNRVGRDGHNMPYNGHSAVCDALGETLAFAENTEAVVQLTIEKASLYATRNHFKFLHDKDDFTIQY